MTTFPRTTFTMESYSYNENDDNVDEVRITKTTQEETVTELAEMFLKYLQANGFTYAKGIAVMTDGGSEFTTDDYYAYEEERSEPDVTLDFYGDEEQPDINIDTDQLQFEFPTDNVTLGETVTMNTSYSGSFNMYPGDITVTYSGGSIDDATPEEWDAVAKKS